MLISKTENKETKENLLQNFQMDSDKRVNVKNIFPDMNPIIKKPIDLKRISKQSESNLNVKSLAKALGVFLTTLGGYFLIKKTNVFSYFGLKTKNLNSKKVNNNEIVAKRMENTLKVRDSKIVEKFPSLFTIRKIQSYDDKEKIVKFEEMEIYKFNEDIPYKICEKFQYIDRTSFYINNLYLATEGKSHEGYGMAHTAYNSNYVSIQIFKMLYAVEYIGFLDKVKEKIEILSSKMSSKVALFYREPGQSDYSKVTVVFSKFLLDDMMNCNKNSKDNVIFYDLYMNKNGNISIKPKCLVPNEILCDCNSLNENNKDTKEEK